MKKKHIAVVAAAIGVGVGLVVWHAWWTDYGAAIRPPSAATDVPATRVALRQSEAQTVALRSGTTFEVPAGAFVDPASGEVPEEVTFVVREFSSAMDLLRAGIPMQMEPGGAAHLESAGMLEVRAEAADGAALALQEGAAIRVALASDNPGGAAYRLWALDDDDGTWSDAGDVVTMGNARRDSLLARADSLLALEGPAMSAEELLPEQWIFELDGGDGAPYLAPYKNVQWEWIPAEAGQTPPLLSLRPHWTEVSVARLSGRRKGLHEITFTCENVTTRGEIVRHETTILAKMLDSRQRQRQLEEAYAVAKADWDDAMAQVREERLFAAQQGGVLHAFQLTGLGYINVDKLESAEDWLLVSLDFDFADKLRFLDKSQIQLILHSSQSILSFQAADWDAVRIPATGDVSLFAMTDDGRVAVLPAPAFDEQVRGRARPRPFVASVFVRTEAMTLDEALARLEERGSEG